ncbi:DNA-directed DNA polymerase [Powellomyces hirtus]|uniref:DNA polymerase n=1 Tax=Powellomyces hirtus TaxID=109895 RepID=A0A507DPT1_9FUNG|nr:DNA-directed DNA polymerase [Powellomyces hirtus]
MGKRRSSPDTLIDAHVRFSPGQPKTKHAKKDLSNAKNAVSLLRLDSGSTPPLASEQTDYQHAEALKTTSPKRTSHESLTNTRNKLFGGLCASLISENISRVRAKIIRRLWTSNGGTLDDTAQTAKLILSEVSPSRLRQILDVQQLPEGVQVIYPDWVSRCIASNALLDPTICQVSDPVEVDCAVASDGTLTDIEIGDHGSETASDSTEVLELERVSGPLGSDTTHLVTSAPAFTENMDTSRKAETTSEVSADSLLSRIIHEEQDRTRLSVDGANADRFESDFDVESDEFDGIDDEVIEIDDDATATKPEDSLTKGVDQPKIRSQGRFLCMQENGRKDIDMNNKNAQITDVLEVLLRRSEAEGEHFRVLSYRRAIQTLKRHGKTIESGSEARKIFGIGGKMADIIDEVIETGRSRKAETVPESQAVLALFQGVHGCGIKVARSWYAQGCRTLDDVRAKARPTHNQLLGLQFYDDLQQKMPRNEAGAIGECVIQTCRSIDSKSQCTIMGSYRRGRPMCGDVDVIVTHPDGRSHQTILPALIARLKESSSLLLIADLHLHSSSSGYDSATSYMGICRLPEGAGIHRRLDIWTVPWDEMGAAFLHWTGNDIL